MSRSAVLPYCGTDLSKAQKQKVQLDPLLGNRVLIIFKCCRSQESFFGVHTGWLRAGSCSASVGLRAGT